MVMKPQTFHGEPPVVDLETKSEHGLERRVADLLAVSDGIDAADIHVTEADDTVLLSGYVMLPAEIDRAAEIAASVPGVKGIRLELRVKPPLSPSQGLKSVRNRAL